MDGQGPGDAEGGDGAPARRRGPARRAARPAGGGGRAALVAGGAAILVGAALAALAALGGGPSPTGLARDKGTYTIVETTLDGLLGKRVELTGTTLRVTGHEAEAWVDDGPGRVRLRLPGAPPGAAPAVLRWGWRGQPVRLWLEEEGGGRAALALEPVR